MMPKTISRIDCRRRPVCVTDAASRSAIGCALTNAFRKAQARDSKGRNPFLARALFHHVATHLRLIRRVLAAAKPEAIAKRGEAP